MEKVSLVRNTLEYCSNDMGGVVQRVIDDPDSLPEDVLAQSREDVQYGYGLPARFSLSSLDYLRCSRRFASSAS